MAIVKMSKFSLFIMEEDKERLLEILQKFKYIHFVNLQDQQTFMPAATAETYGEETLTKLEEEIQKVSFSIQVLSKFAAKQTGLQRFKEGTETVDIDDLAKKAADVDFPKVYKIIRENVDKKERIDGEINQLTEQMTELEPWLPLDMSMESMTSWKNCAVLTGSVPKRFLSKVEQDLADDALSSCRVISEDDRYVYIIAMTHQTEAGRIQEILLRNGFTNIDLKFSGTPEEEMSSLTERIQNLQDERRKADIKIKEISRVLPGLELLYDYLFLIKTRVLAANNFLRTNRLNMIAGYLPLELTGKFSQVISKELGEHYYLNITEARENDPEVPVLLNNSKYFQPFESITKMYALPKYGEIDPTPLFSVFYWLFFGMMVGDAGYGLLLLIICYIILKVFNLSEKQRNFIQLFYFMSFSIILWGIVYGSFFGDLLSFPSFITPTEEYSLLLVLSMSIGVIHIFFALGIQGYMDLKKGNMFDAICNTGFWYMALGSGIFYLLSFFIPVLHTGKNISLAIMLAGMAGILVTGGRNSKSAGGKIAGGLYRLYGISGYVGDFVSYSRLMALGLASAFIAQAINLMVAMLSGLGFIGIILGIAVFIAGQGFNIFLSLLSSYVHNLRLTYVEFFGKFYEGGGKAFQVFRSQSKYINIK